MKRYTPDISYGREGSDIVILDIVFADTVIMVEDDDGAYVLYEDAVRQRDVARARVAELRARLGQVKDAWNKACTRLTEARERIAELEVELAIARERDE